MMAACTTAAPEVSPPPRATAAAVASRLETLVAPHKQKARALEQEGQLRKALEEWRIALTLNASDAAALDAKKTLEARIERTVSDRLREGRAALAKGAHLEARRHFLAALALAPSNKAAFEALRSDVKEIRLLTHTVGKGETLASIAEHYYGDRSRSEVIWETNQLPPNPRLVAGSTLKIPEIPGVPFVHPDAIRERARPSSPSEPSRAEPGGETPEINPLLLEAREALERKEFVVALADIEKVLASNPQNPDGLDLKNVVLYEQGKTQFSQKKYEDSYRTLTTLVRLSPNYQDAVTLLGQARTAMVQERYNEGIRLYREEKLDGAIAQWKRVLEFDPSHAGAKRNIEQAERLLRGLQQRQQQKR